MATTFQTRDSKLAYKCRKAKREGVEITVSADVKGRTREITGRVLEVALSSVAGPELIWEVTIAEHPRS